MENLFNFLNNFRTNAAQWEQDLNERTNKALNQMGQGLGQAANYGINTITAPFRATGQEMGNTINQVGQSTQNAWNGFNRDVVAPVTNTMYGIANKVNNAAGLGGNQAQNQSQTQPTDQQSTLDKANRVLRTGNTYQKDAGIETFISALRMAMNPLRGITGNTPLDVIADVVSDSLYSSFGKQIATPAEDKAKESTTGKTSETTKENTTTTPEEEQGEVIAYTYQPGDTFGEVIQKLGLMTNNGLWGANGDVDYYTKQLIEQGIWPNGVSGNIPIGTTIKLRRRK